MSSYRTVIALDFDHTVVNDNTDTVVRDLLKPEQIPESVRQLYRGSDWLSYMQQIFNLLHEHGFGKERILNTIRGIPETPGFCDLIQRMAERPDVDILIISDSNTVFIDAWLEKHRLTSCIRKVFTNYAYFPDDGGPLQVREYHHQTECSMSSLNLCKGKVLTDFLKDNPEFKHCIYAGDGRNDVCPMLRLTEKDLACPRVGYPCAKALQGEQGAQLKAPLFLWETGYELIYKATCQLKAWKGEQPESD